MTRRTAAAGLRRLRAALPYIVVLAAAIFLYHSADRFQFEQVSGRIGPGAWPKLILDLLIVTALWGCVSSFIGAGKPVSDRNAQLEEAEALVRPPELYPHLVWIAIGTTLCYLFLLPILGFFLGTVLYSFILIWLGHYRKPLRVVVLSFAIALAFMFMFMRVVYVSLPVGIKPFNHVSFAIMSALGVH